MLIAIDIGTTHVKAVAFSMEGAVLATVSCANITLSNQEGRQEQEAEAVFQNVLGVLHEIKLKAVENVSTRSVKGIVFSSAMHGLLAVDKWGKPLTNIMLWSDLRAAEEAKLLLQEGGEGPALYRLTGVPIHPMSPLLKLIWMRQHLPQAFQVAHKFLGIKEYIWYRLTGKFESDISCASATGLMNLQSNQWEDRALALTGILAERLPDLVTPRHRSEALPGILLENTPLIIGASDGALANLGSGATQPGDVAITIGTSAAIRVMTESPLLDEQMRSFCYRLDEKRFIVGGASNNGTNALEWLRKHVVKSPLLPDAFANLASTVPPGADGLRFYPYLYGERAPIWDAGARASFEGLKASHEQAHFVRAVMEGVILNLYTIANVLEENTRIHTIYASGGFTHNALWVSILEDIFHKKVVVDISGTDASARGAFLIGKEALGL